MPDAYLLDTSIASMAWNAGSSLHTQIRQRLATLSEDSISVCVISISEVEYGLEISPAIDAARQAAVRQAMLQYKLWDIDRHTATYHAGLRAGLFEKYGTPKQKRGGFRERQPEELLDRTTARELGIQENDLWIVSVAVQYDLRFITMDRMTHILDVANDVYAYDRAERWAPPF